MTLGNGSDQATMEYSLRYNPPMDLVVGERNLKEVKQILDGLGVVFVLGSGACLGAVRDKALIPWDDDVDLVSVIGVNGLTEGSIDGVLAAFRESGYYVRRNYSANAIGHSIIKDYMRVDWSCTYIIDDILYTYPEIPLPAKLFTHPKEIEFLGEKFFVPNPPEEFLRLKYGPEWMVPKRPGIYEKDVVAKIPAAKLIGRPCSLRILDHEGHPVPEAEVVLVGGGISITDEHGYSEIILPDPGWYALVIRYPGHEQVLYMEEMEPDKVYVYRADSVANAASHASGATGMLGNVLELE